jgi:hypothetical protein
MRNRMEASEKTKHRSAIRSNNTIPRDIPKGMQHRFQQGYLYIHVYCSTIHNSHCGNSQDVPLPMNALRVCGIYHNGILFSHKEE